MAGRLIMHTERPWCGDDAYMLGWGVLTLQAMVGSVAAGRHG